MEIPELQNLFIYPTWKCNLNCAHCWLDERESENILSIELIDSAINDALGMGLKYIKISGGEPLLTKDITEYIVKKAGENNVKVAIETNGTMIDEKWATLFAENKVQVGISIDSYKEEEHDIFRGKQGAFTESINAIKMLVGKGCSTGIIHSISTINTEEIDKMVELSKELGAKYLKLNPIVKVGKGKSFTEGNDFIFTLLPKEIIKLNNMYRSSDLPVIVMLPVGLSSLKKIVELPAEEQFRCANCPTLNLASILPNGKVGLCAEAYRNTMMHFGDLNEVSLKEIWYNSDELKELRGVIPDNMDGVCGKCLMKNICKGSCRSISVAQYGKISSPHPICQHLYENNLFHLAKKSKEELPV